MMDRCCRIALLVVLALFGLVQVESFQPVPTRNARTLSSTSSPSRPTCTTSLKVTTKENTNLDETTEKFGLEAGLAQAAQEGNGESAKSLLKKYGIAYLATSIPLAIASFAICYALIDSGVDVGALLAKVGIEDSGAADKAGTFAIAYAAHKAASPIRFPPTVILTPLVAKLIGKEPAAETEADAEADA
jgi:hypothetical protein